MPRKRPLQPKTELGSSKLGSIEKKRKGFRKITVSVIIT